MTRSLSYQLALPGSPEQVFDLLCTPSSIRRWWGVDRAIIIPELGGLWVAAWGQEEDDPEYVTAATISRFEPPSCLELSDYRYRSKSGPLPFDADFVTVFDIDSHRDGSLLKVTQHGFPSEESADAYYQACQQGWIDTFEGISQFLQQI